MVLDGDRHKYSTQVVSDQIPPLFSTSTFQVDSVTVVSAHLVAKNHSSQGGPVAWDGFQTNWQRMGAMAETTSFIVQIP